MEQKHVCYRKAVEVGGRNPDILLSGKLLQLVLRDPEAFSGLNNVHDPSSVFWV